MKKLFSTRQLEIARNYKDSSFSSNNEDSSNHLAAYQRTIYTVGAGNNHLSDYYGNVGCEETVFPSVEGLIYYLDDLRVDAKPDVIICMENLDRANIQQLISFLSASKSYYAVPVIMLKGKVSTKDKRGLMQFGIDDLVDSSISQELFFERIKMISITKENSIKYTQEDFQVSLENYKINIFKRVFDITISSLLLIALSPIIIPLAILIKLESKGPIFYISKRAGGGYRIFNFYKLRSMADGSDKEMNKVVHLNNYGDGDSVENKIFYKIKGDPRVTRVGAFIRRTSIDELPQLINVLKGDMSLVGNRPLPLYEAQQLTRDNWAARFNAPAGITGLWQVTREGKDNLTAEERLELDLKYSTSNNFWLDIKILAKTFRAVVQKDNF